MRCKACNAALSVYDLTVKRPVKLENGTIIEVFEDLCGRCRRAVSEVDEVEQGAGVGAVVAPLKATADRFVVGEATLFVTPIEIEE